MSSGIIKTGIGVDAGGNAVHWTGISWASGHGGGPEMQWGDASRLVWGLRGPDLHGLLRTAQNAVYAAQSVEPWSGFKAALEARAEEACEEFWRGTRRLDGDEYRDACSGILDPFAADAAWQEAVKRAA